MSLGAKRKAVQTYACGEKTGGIEVMWAALLTVLDAGNSSGDEEAVHETAVRYDWE